MCSRFYSDRWLRARASWVSDWSWAHVRQAQLKKAMSKFFGRPQMKAWFHFMHPYLVSSGIPTWFKSLDSISTNSGLYSGKLSSILTSSCQLMIVTSFAYSTCSLHFVLLCRFWFVMSCVDSSFVYYDSGQLISKIVCHVSLLLGIAPFFWALLHCFYRNIKQILGQSHFSFGYRSLIFAKHSAQFNPDP